jgi:ribosome-associated protein
MASSETRTMVLAAATICDEKKGEDTKILELDPADSGFTDFFLITSGINEKQTQAIADGIELELKRKFATYPNSVEGRKLGEWILMDYVDFVVHIFLVEKRAYYDIERLRKSARHMDVVELKAALTERTLAVRKKSRLKTAARTAIENAAKPAVKSVSAKAVKNVSGKTSISGKTTVKKSTRTLAKKAMKTEAANRTN